MPETDAPTRPLPGITIDNEAFWTGGARGELLIARCRDCAYYVHPPTSFCPRCEGRTVAAEPVSGRATVTSYTVNHKQWLPGLPVPYVLALVELEEQEGLRLPTNIVGCDPERVHIGMRVRVTFALDPAFPSADRARSVTYGEKRVAITGIGMSDVSRGATKSALDLTIDACLEAIADAGLRREDIDGLSSYPGGDNNASGYSPVSVHALHDALRLKLDWFSGGIETPGQLGAVFNAIGAIAAGYCRHILVFRTVYEASARRAQRFANAMMSSDAPVYNGMAPFAPYWALSAATQQALYFQRYKHEYGVTAEQTGAIAINNRRNAGGNTKAIYRTPLTMAEYLASPLISTPLRMHDCDVPCDGSVALVVSHIEAARDLRNPPLRFEAVGSALRYRPSWDQLEPLATQVTPSSAEMMWNRTDLRPTDVDAAQLYDGFTYHTLTWLESGGFVKRGEAGAFVEGGRRIALDGELPINTGGGQLSAGRLHGYGQLHEACTQMWRRGGDRQVRKEVNISFNATAGGIMAGCMLLVKD